MGRLVHTDREFVGSTALANRAAEGPRSFLTALTGTGRRAARTGYDVLDGEQVVGQITSGVLSPTLGHPIALARTTSAYETGQVVGVDVDPGREHQVFEMADGGSLLAETVTEEDVADVARSTPDPSGHGTES